MFTRSARLGSLLLCATLLATPAVAQDTGDAVTDTGSVSRTWEIYLKSGQRIAFVGQLSWSGAAKGPSQFLADYQAFVAGGATPPISRYSFPSGGDASLPAADMVIDLREVSAVVQKF
jgi:hypothetical protein